jgi:hypothetical protein
VIGAAADARDALAAAAAGQPKAAQHKPG